VLIDFSLPHAIKDYVSLVRELQKPLVVGTTGLKESELNKLRGLAETAPVVWAPNMSIGINVLRNLVQSAAKLLPETFSVHITETHHAQKKDAPSGTAKQLAADLKSVLKNPDIPIDCVRAGDVVGEHTVTFYGQGERIELVHRATSRDIFASGALTAAKWILNKKPQFYSMKDVLEGA